MAILKRKSTSEDGESWVDKEPNEVAYGYAQQNEMIKASFLGRDILDIYQKSVLIYIRKSPLFVDVFGTPFHYNEEDPAPIEYPTDDDGNTIMAENKRFYVGIKRGDSSQETEIILIDSAEHVPRYSHEHNSFVVVIDGVDYKVLKQVVIISDYKEKGNKISPHIVRMARYLREDYWTPEHTYYAGQFVRENVFSDKVYLSISGSKNIFPGTDPREWKLFLDARNMLAPNWVNYNSLTADGRAGVHPVGSTITIGQEGDAGSNAFKLYEYYENACNKLPHVTVKDEGGDDVELVEWEYLGYKTRLRDIAGHKLGLAQDADDDDKAKKLPQPAWVIPPKVRPYFTKNFKVPEDNVKVNSISGDFQRHIGLNQFDRNDYDGSSWVTFDFIRVK